VGAKLSPKPKPLDSKTTDTHLEPDPLPSLMGVFSVVNQKAVILFNSGVSHTFINRAFAVKYQLPIEVMDNSFCIQSPGGRMIT
jgi:hypothetical protein